MVTVSEAHNAVSSNLRKKSNSGFCFLIGILGSGPGSTIKLTELASPV